MNTFSAIREELNASTGRVLVVVVEASDLSSPKQNEGIDYNYQINNNCNLINNWPSINDVTVWGSRVLWWLSKGFSNKMRDDWGRSKNQIVWRHLWTTPLRVIQIKICPRVASHISFSKRTALFRLAFKFWNEYENIACFKTRAQLSRMADFFWLTQSLLFVSHF